MASSSDSADTQAKPSKSSDYKTPGLRGIRTTNLFRAVNPELFIKPNKTVMALGLLSITVCVGYIAYLNATSENKRELYEAIDSEGTRSMRRKTSKWD
ncbi:small integral membrane protein 8 [Callorhinchus milii]|uniref:Small integral membrane protein 8 n=1 Tax=Callorhinchus milii TaxID=7868 RepID=A0A4W3J8W3_CALMI|nr:small integral membrane protein 8 [Callorhinchus milii]XP_007903255.1 small integral membrane protein 8 [Callorhinchus milii]|eukprot:gi/632973647/ref/XP_007903254.1/ PREDICTED: small integral membrane protein 8 [Callorhinchus milii]